MRNIVWLGLGAIIGAVAATITLVVAYFFFASPVRRLESVSGLELPPRARLSWERHERSGFLGQGFTLHAISVPKETAKIWLADCPLSFSSARLDESGIWSKIKERGVEGSTLACVMSIESATRQEVVVVSTEQIFHLSLDR